ncbi:Unknown protein, partial [Striga hermonthica]
MAKLDKEKSSYGETMYEIGFQAGKDSIPEVETVQVGNEDVAGDAGAEVEEEIGPDLELEMNTCLTLRWVIERYNVGYYDINELRFFLFHKLEKYGFDMEIKGMHIEAYEDEREFCEWMLRRAEEVVPNPDLPQLTEEMAALLRRAYVNMILEGEKGKRKELADVYLSTLTDVEVEQHFDDMTPEQIRNTVKAYIKEKAKSVDKEVKIFKVVTPAEGKPDE